MIKLSKKLFKNKTIKHRFLWGAMFVLFVLCDVKAQPKLDVQYKIMQPTCDTASKGAIYLTVNGGTPPYTYKWSNGSDKSFIENLVGNGYSVTIKDSKGVVFDDYYAMKKAKPISYSSSFYHCFGSLRFFGSEDGTPMPSRYENYVSVYMSFANVMHPIKLSADYFTQDTSNKNIKLGRDVYNLASDVSNKKPFQNFGVTLLLEEQSNTRKGFDKPVPYDPNLFLKIRILDANGCTFDTIIQAQGGRKLEFINLDSMPNRYTCEGLAVNQNKIEFKSNVHQDSMTNIYWSFFNGHSNVSLKGKDAIVPPFMDKAVLYITHTNGCEFEKRIFIDCDYDLNKFVFFPTAFSPNGDGINDIFFMNSADNVISHIDRLAVYNRWGELVYEQKDIAPNDSSKGWDGFYRNSEAVSDVYTCIATCRLYNDTVRTLRGNVMLMR